MGTANNIRSSATVIKEAEDKKLAQGGKGGQGIHWMHRVEIVSSTECRRARHVQIGKCFLITL